MKQNLYSELLHRAVEFAATKHEGQWRKHPHKNIPYISHPVCVGLTLQRAGYADEVVAAGILHDVVEDCGVSPEAVADLFGERISYLVRQVSEPDRTVDWSERKRLYREVLEKADTDAVAVAAADHLHNIQSLIQGMAADIRMRRSFTVKLEDRLGHEKACLEIVERRLPGQLADELGQAVAELTSLLSV